MSEEDVKLEQEVPVKDEPVVEVQEAEEASVEAEAPQFSDTEIAAMEQGWKPPEEFQDEGKEPISAEEFIRRGELFDKIKEVKHNSRRELRRMEEQMREMTDLLKEERTRGYEQALRDLDAKRREAVEIGDVEAFNSYDLEYNRVQEEKQATAHKFAEPAPAIPEAALEFQERNADWFNSNTPENNSMVTQAVQIDEFLSKEKPYLSDEQRLNLVEQEIKTLYKHRFENPKKKAPSKVEAPAKDSVAARPSSNGLAIKVSDLDERQKEAAKRFLSMDPSLTMEDYLKSVQEGMRIRHQL